MFKMEDFFIVDNGTLPTYGSRQAAAFDIYSNTDIELLPNKPTLVSTGLYLNPEIGESLPGYFLLLLPRSGLATKGVMLANSPGLVDIDYTGEIKVILTYIGDTSYKITKGDRICQGMFMLRSGIMTALSLGNDAPKRVGGFGSTGV